MTAPAFTQLCEVCRDSYRNSGETGPKYALDTALRSLGLPCLYPPEEQHLAGSVEDAVLALDEAFRATTVKRVHMAPLDVSGEIPEIDFGTCSIKRISKEEFERLIDKERLDRSHRPIQSDLDKLTDFSWMIVQENVKIEQEPNARAAPIFYTGLRVDFGQIEPHKKRFPCAFEDALTALLILPWEDWSTMKDFDWRPFHIPWVHTVDSDIFVRLAPLPSPDTLTWDYDCRERADGIIEEIKVPCTIDIEIDENPIAAGKLNQYLSIIKHHSDNSILDTPVFHFFVSGFLENGIDEFLNHVIAIESILGVREDHIPSLRRNKTLYAKNRSTEIICCRVAGLLNEKKASSEYTHLFKLRSEFIHGRKSQIISSNDRVLARSLARKVVKGILDAAGDHPEQCRETFLNNLFCKGKSFT